MLRPAARRAPDEAVSAAGDAERRCRSAASRSTGRRATACSTATPWGCSTAPAYEPGAVVRRQRRRRRRAACWRRCSPRKVVAVGLNYRAHAAELAMAVHGRAHHLPQAAQRAWWARTTPSWRRRASAQVDYEAELALVVGRRCRAAGAADAASFVAGYTCGNDVTARDLQKVDGQWTRAQELRHLLPARAPGRGARRAAARRRRDGGARRRRGAAGEGGRHDRLAARPARLRLGDHDPRARRRHPHRHAARRRAAQRGPGGDRRRSRASGSFPTRSQPEPEPADRANRAAGPRPPRSALAPMTRPMVRRGKRVCFVLAIAFDKNSVERRTVIRAGRHQSMEA